MNLDNSIEQLIEQQPVSDQAALLDLLAAQGHRLTQPTLSRHLRKLGIIKRDGRYRRQAEHNADIRFAARILISPPNLLILRTEAGFAQALGLHLDAQPLPNQAGTLAGDDTVFVALLSGDELALTLQAARQRFASS